MAAAITFSNDTSRPDQEYYSTLTRKSGPPLSQFGPDHKEPDIARRYPAGLRHQTLGTFFCSLHRPCGAGPVQRCISPKPPDCDVRPCREWPGALDTVHMADTMISEGLGGHLHSITGAQSDYDSLLDLVGDRKFVLIGEASHGTHDFYAERARITRRLIDECGFNAVAVEADWPDAYRVNRYVMGLSDDADADTALSDFRRFPAWMWRNYDVLPFVEWLRSRNDIHESPGAKARFYGLDLYSLRASMEAVVRYLDRIDPDESKRA